MNWRAVIIGPNLVKLARPRLGISAFGANIVDLPPAYSRNSHDESASGYEPPGWSSSRE